MNRKPGIVICIVAAAVLTGLTTPQHASAENPFYYYPAYGAQRGKIVYRDGPFVNRQKIRWGNGLTEYGAGVFNNAIGAAVQILPVVLKDDGSPDADKSSGVAVSLPDNYTAELRRANDLLERSARLAGVNLGAVAVGGEETELPPTRWDERFQNSTDPWEAVVPTPAPTPTPTPMPETPPAPNPDPALGPVPMPMPGTNPAPAPANVPPVNTTPPQSPEGNSVPPEN